LYILIVGQKDFWTGTHISGGDTMKSTVIALSLGLILTFSLFGCSRDKAPDVTPTPTQTTPGGMMNNGDYNANEDGSVEDNAGQNGTGGITGNDNSIGNGGGTGNGGMTGNNATTGDAVGNIVNGAGDAAGDIVNGVGDAARDIGNSVRNALR